MGCRANNPAAISATRSPLNRRSKNEHQPDGNAIQHQIDEVKAEWNQAGNLVGQ